MSKYILNFSELNSDADVDVVSFTSAKKRANYIAERVIGSNPKRVFTLVVSYDDNDDNACDVYVFDQWTCIKEVVQQRWKSFWLFEWSSYEDAYKNALDMKEVSPLCSETKPCTIHDVVCSAYPYNGYNGIMICCRSCGKDIEETDNGYYQPIVYEHEKYERQCRQCRES